MYEGCQGEFIGGVVLRSWYPFALWRRLSAWHLHNAQLAGHTHELALGARTPPLGPPVPRPPLPLCALYATCQCSSGPRFSAADLRQVSAAVSAAQFTSGCAVKDEPPMLSKVTLRRSSLELAAAAATSW